VWSQARSATARLLLAGFLEAINQGVSRPEADSARPGHLAGIDHRRAGCDIGELQLQPERLVVDHAHKQGAHRTRYRSPLVPAGFPKKKGQPRRNGPAQMVVDGRRFNSVSFA
jgi:hypothetical protein